MKFDSTRKDFQTIGRNLITVFGTRHIILMFVRTMMNVKVFTHFLYLIIYFTAGGERVENVLVNNS